MAPNKFYQHGCEERSKTSIKNRTQIFRPVNSKVTGWYISGRDIVQRFDIEEVLVVLILKCT